MSSEKILKITEEFLSIAENPLASFRGHFTSVNGDSKTLLEEVATGSCFYLNSSALPAAKIKRIAHNLFKYSKHCVKGEGAQSTSPSVPVTLFMYAIALANYEKPIPTERYFSYLESFRELIPAIAKKEIENGPKRVVYVSAQELKSFYANLNSADQAKPVIEILYLCCANERYLMLDEFCVGLTQGFETLIKSKKYDLIHKWQETRQLHLPDLMDKVWALYTPSFIVDMASWLSKAGKTREMVSFLYEASLYAEKNPHRGNALDGLFSEFSAEWISLKAKEVLEKESDFKVYAEFLCSFSSVPEKLGKVDKAQVKATALYLAKLQNALQAEDKDLGNLPELSKKLATLFHEADVPLERVRLVSGNKRVTDLSA